MAGRSRSPETGEPQNAGGLQSAGGPYNAGGPNNVGGPQKTGEPLDAGRSTEAVRPEASGHSPDDSAGGRVTRLPPDAKPRRQLRRTGVKIGRRVLPYERTVLRLGPLRLVRDANGRLALRWIRRGR